MGEKEKTVVCMSNFICQTSIWFDLVRVLSISVSESEYMKTIAHCSRARHRSGYRQALEVLAEPKFVVQPRLLPGLKKRKGLRSVTKQRERASGGFLDLPLGRIQSRKWRRIQLSLRRLPRSLVVVSCSP